MLVGSGRALGRLTTSAVTLAVDRQGERLADRGGLDRRLECPRASNRLAPEVHDQIAGPQKPASRREAGLTPVMATAPGCPSRSPASASTPLIEMPRYARRTRPYSARVGRHSTRPDGRQGEADPLEAAPKS